MNDDRLSDREHSEMRDTVLAGTQRIKPAGAHRAQFIAGAVALVLIGGITGGAVTTAALLGSGPDTISSTPTPSVTAEPSPTLDPDPTPTVEPEPAPTEGVMPFAGECANVLNDDEVDAVTGIPMMRSDYRWETGSNAVLGGIDCVWVSEEVYLEATTHFYAYPQASAPQRLVAMETGCAAEPGGSGRIDCALDRVVNGTWMQVRVVGAGEAVTESGTEQLLTAAAERFEEYPAPVPVTPTSAWWALLDCNDLVAKVDPALYGHERVALIEYPGDGNVDDQPGARQSCNLHFTSGSGETSSGEVVWVSVVPGGAISFQTALDAEHSQSANVEGAADAVFAPGLDRYEGSASILVVTDGVNILMVSPDWGRESSDVEPLAAALLGMMHP